jgi:hypothetical protein
MWADVETLKKIDIAVSNNKLELSDDDRRFIDSVRNQIGAQRNELSRKQRQWLGNIQARIRAF